MFDDPTRISEIELRPILSKGELVVDDWWKGSQPKREASWRRHWLVIVTLCIPVALAIVYFGFVASGQYVSEARFFVRTSALGDTANLASFMQNQKITRASDETIAVSEYITSRDALRALVENDRLLAILSSPAADLFNRFPNFYSRDNTEALYNHFRGFVDVHVEGDSGIATLRARAFRPEDAQHLTQALLKDAEAFVNRLNTRVYEDTLKLANRSVDEERVKFAEIEERLTRYRNAQKVIDPNKEAVAALGALGTLMANLSRAESALSQEIALAPRSPKIPGLSTNVASLRDEVAKQRALISGPDFSLAEKFSEFDQLMLDRELAARGLEAAQIQLSRARQDLEQQQYYLQTIVEPNLPDQALYPRRLFYIAFVFAISFCVYWILRALLTNVREHQA